MLNPLDDLNEALDDVYDEVMDGDVSEESFSGILDILTRFGDDDDPS